MHQDLVASVLGVGGTETDVDTPGEGNGLIRLGNRRFQVAPGGDGQYLFMMQGDFTIDIDANVFAAILVNDDPESATFSRKLEAKAGPNNWITLFGLREVVEGDIIELTYQVTGGANTSDERYEFSGMRLG